MKCNNCGAEVPEGKTTCPNCAADPSAPKKVKQLGKYRESIKAFRRICIFEWFNLLLGVAVIFVCLKNLQSDQNIEESLNELGTVSVFEGPLAMIIISSAFAGWAVAMTYFYDAMKYFEESFYKIIKVRLGLLVTMFLFMGTPLNLLTFLLLIMMAFIPGLIALSVYYHRLFWSLSAYIKELSPVMSARFDLLGTIYPCLIIMATLLSPFIMAMVSLTGIDWLLVLLPITFQFLLMLVLAMLLFEAYRLCRSTVVSPDR